MHTWTMILILAACINSFLIGRIYQQFQFQKWLDEYWGNSESPAPRESLQSDDKE